MRKFVMIAAAAAGMIGGGAAVSTPSFADPLLCNPFVHQAQCALNFKWKAGTSQTIDQGSPGNPKQRIILKGHTDNDDLHGLLQLQLAGNIAVKAGGSQSITQDQQLTLHDHADAHGWPGDAPQTQVGLNVEYKAGVDQSINQSQSMDASEDFYGSQQNQTAINVAVESHGGSQTITQGQSISSN